MPQAEGGARPPHSNTVIPDPDRESRLRINQQPAVKRIATELE